MLFGPQNSDQWKRRIGAVDLARGVLERGDRVDMLNSLAPLNKLHPNSCSAADPNAANTHDGCERREATV